MRITLVPSLADQALYRWVTGHRKIAHTLPVSWVVGFVVFRDPTSHNYERAEQSTYPHTVRLPMKGVDYVPPVSHSGR